MTKQLDDTKQLNNLVKKHKQYLFEKQNLAPFKEPIVFLMRENGKMTFHENAVQQKWRYTHSNGEERYINLEPTHQQKFQYANQQIKCYICHENQPFPLPDTPENTAELFRIQNEKAMHDTRKYHAEEIKARGQNWKYILYGIAAIIGMYALYTTMKPAETPQVIIQQPAIGTPTILTSFISLQALTTYQKWRNKHDQKKNNNKNK